MGSPVRAVIPDMPEGWLEGRSRLGLDRYDEVWEGVLHIPPAPGLEHQSLGSELLMVPGPRLKAHHVVALYQTEVHRPGSAGSDYRIPDLVFFGDDQPELLFTSRGLEGGPLAVLEILSPDGGSRESVPQIEPPHRGREARPRRNRAAALGAVVPRPTRASRRGGRGCRCPAPCARTRRSSPPRR
jgi:hypothetical protein